MYSCKIPQQDLTLDNIKVVVERTGNHDHAAKATKVHQVTGQELKAVARKINEEANVSSK